MNPNIKASDQVTLLETRNPISQSAATVTTGWISAANFAAYLAKLSVGALGASATVDAKLEQATNSSGGSAKDITGKAITQLTKAGTDDNKQVFINLRPEELDVANAFTHFRLSITVGTAACLIQADVYGLGGRYQPASHATTVDEVVE